MKNEYSIKGDTVEIYYKRKRDGLRYTAIIDLADFDLVNDETEGWWYVGYFGHKKTPYMIATKYRKHSRRASRTISTLMHRLIMGKPKKKVIDHIRGNDSTLDNRRCNLQVTTHSKNILKQKLNTKLTKAGKGTHKHVHREPNGFYTVLVKAFYYGTFDTLAEAITQRDGAIAWHNWHSIGRLIGEAEPIKPTLPKRYLPEAQRRHRLIENIRAYRQTAKGKAAIKRSYLRWKARGYRRVSEALLAA